VDVLMGIGKEKIDVAGKARVAVIDDSLTADHNILYVVFAQEPDELECIRRKMRSLYRIFWLV